MHKLLCKLRERNFLQSVYEHIAKTFFTYSMIDTKQVLQTVATVKTEMDRELAKSMLKVAPIANNRFTHITARQTLNMYKECLTLKERLQALVYVADCIHFFHSRSWAYGALSWDNVFWDKSTNTVTMGDFNRSRADVRRL